MTIKWSRHSEENTPPRTVEKLWSMFDTRITTLNDRTKRQTIQIKELSERIKKLEERK